eukprot:scaffold2992_cov64-Phaeocystis_antarctica.AAC.1
MVKELLGHLPVGHGRRSPRVVRVVVDERDLLRVHLWVVGVHGMGPSSSTRDLLPLHVLSEDPSTMHPRRPKPTASGAATL